MIWSDARERARFRGFEKRTSTARKDHACILCPDVIKAGTQYIRLAHLVDGNFQSDHFHVACWLKEFGP